MVTPSKREGGFLGGTDATVAAEHRLDPGGDLAWAERLGDVVIRADAQPDEFVDLLRPCGDQDDVDVAEGAQLAEHLEPVDPGHHHVQQHQVRLVGRASRPAPRHRRRPPPPRNHPPAGTRAARCGYAARRRRPTPFAWLATTDYDAPRPGSLLGRTSVGTEPPTLPHRSHCRTEPTRCRQVAQFSRAGQCWLYDHITVRAGAPAHCPSPALRSRPTCQAQVRHPGRDGCTV